MDMQITAIPSRASHGGAVNYTKTKEYRAWCNMVARCTNPKDARYYLYGGRGITVFSGWLHDYPAFFAAVGLAPSEQHSLDRENNDRGYVPGNVRWATRREQAVNRRCALTATLSGVTKPLIEWCECLGMPYAPVKSRLNLGWSDQMALTVPVKSRNLS